MMVLSCNFYNAIYTATDDSENLFKKEVQAPSLHYLKNPPVPNTLVFQVKLLLNVILDDSSWCPDTAVCKVLYINVLYTTSMYCTLHSCTVHYIHVLDTM